MFGPGYDYPSMNTDDAATITGIPITPSSSVITVGYARKRLASKPAIYHPLAAILLCTPGMLCWILLLSIVAGFAPPFVIPFFKQGYIFALIGLAVTTAMISLPVYLYRPLLRKPWHVYLNLVVNVSGLIFVAWLFSRG